MGLFADLGLGNPGKEFTGFKVLEDPDRVGLFVTDRELAELTPSKLLIMPGIELALSSTAFLSSPLTLQLNSFTKAGLPVAGAAGRLARVTDKTRGLWMDTGSDWISLTSERINVKEFGAKGDGIADDSVAIQAAINSLPSSGPAIGGTLLFPPGTYLLSIGLKVETNYVRFEGSGWSQTAGVIFKAIAAIDMLRIAGGRGFSLHGIEFDGNLKLALSGVKFTANQDPAVNPSSYSQMNQFRVHDCQTGLVVGELADRAVVGMQFSNFFADRNGIGIQQNGVDTGDISYYNGAITDNSVVGFDMGNTFEAHFLHVGTNGQNGPGGDFRGGSVNNTVLTIEGASHNPTQGPWLNFPQVGLSLHAITIIVKNATVGWGGLPGGDLITYKGYGSVTLIGGFYANEGVIRVSPASAVSNSGPNLIDIGTEFRGSPEPPIVVTGGRRFSVLPVSVNVGARSGAQLTNAPYIGSTNSPGNAATVDVSFGNYFKVSGGVTIENFVNGFIGQTIHIYAAGAKTIGHNASIRLVGGVNYVMNAGETLILTQYNSGVWVEESRSAPPQ